MMARLRPWLPGGLAGQFTLLLVTALLAANLVAFATMTIERQNSDRRITEEREIERIASLVPAMEATDAPVRAAIARDASTRFARVQVDDRPLVEQTPADSRSRYLAQRLAATLGNRTVAVTVLNRSLDPARQDLREGQGDGQFIAISIGLNAAGPGAAWLNVMTSGNGGGPPDVEGDMMFLVLCISVIAVLGVGLWFVRRLTRPIVNLTVAARAAGRGDRSARVPEHGARELRDAAVAFNTMQAEIARFDAERTRTLAAVGHDLRTPLTSLRIRAEMIEDPDLRDPMIRTLEEMTVMADGLVTYAKDGHEAEDLTQIDLNVLLRQICQDRGATFSSNGAANVSGRPVSLVRVFGNIIDNAVRYGKGAAVALSSGPDAVIITVEDRGPGIPDERLDAMFQPFTRGENSRNADTGGAGLGLSIARSILHAQGGSITLSNLKPTGLRATIRLPRQV